ncbi:DUF4932 domain-containing protein [Sphingomonas sinipercae]|uniref:DUF4932 domain-containing protein n=1 Tax=Sphingomonas sinipercae TaxID=2714944 RepID=A0A6G7ZPL9_9SPHN|nr:DUF4932 domain-containing protein [Sphingomonas sinipercae]QIL02937.1 DUF4932 domain-containing protein [Sphingomonas sinipercae]
MSCVAGCSISPLAPVMPAPPAAPAAEARLPVTVAADERVELFATIFRLAGADEYSTRFVPAYAKAIDKHFAPFKDHAAVKAVAGLRSSRGVAYNAVVDLAIQFGPLPDLVERVPLERSEMDKRWTPEAARDFAAKARDFARVTDFHRFFVEQRPLYAAAERRLRSLAEDEADLNWVQRFYGGTGKEQFFIVPAPGNGTVYYGSRYFGPAGEREFYSIITAMDTDVDGFPVFPIGVANLLAHEFGHSYVTPLILEHYDRDLKAAGDALLENFGGEMGPQGYSEGSTIIHESIIRAGVAHYRGQRVGPAAAERELAAQRNLGFVWIDDLYKLLGDYERDRARYPDIRSFYPVLRDYFQALPARLPTMKSALDASRPKVVESSPKNGAVNVNPATTTMTVRFDRPMRQSWGWKPRSGDMGAWPELSSPAFDASRTMLTVKVRLQPNTNYEATFLTSQFSGANGVAIAPFTLKFRTGRKR